MKRLTDEKEILNVLDNLAKKNKCYWSCQSSYSNGILPGYCYDNPYETLKEISKETKDIDSNDILLFVGRRADKGLLNNKLALDVRGEKDILYRLSLRDFLQWAVKTDFKYKGTYPLDKDYAAYALGSQVNTPEKELLLKLAQQHYKVSDPIIFNHEKFVDIYKEFNSDSTVKYDIKYNPTGFGDKNYFMYVNTFDDVYRPFISLDDVKVFMSEKAIEKFETVQGNIEIAGTVLKKLPEEFYMDTNFHKMLFAQNENSKFDSEFLKVIDSYIVSNQIDCIKKDLLSKGFTPTKNIVINIFELNKITHRFYTVDEIRSGASSEDTRIHELNKNINKELQNQANHSLELQM